MLLDTHLLVDDSVRLNGGRRAALAVSAKHQRECVDDPAQQTSWCQTPFALCTCTGQQLTLGKLNEPALEPLSVHEPATERGAFR